MNLHQQKLAFKECDRGDKGYLTRKEFKIAHFAIFGYIPSKFETSQLQVDQITLESFIELVSKKQTRLDQYDFCRQLFLNMDRDCKGVITLEDFQKVVGIDDKYSRIIFKALCQKDLNYSRFEEIIINSNS